MIAIFPFLNRLVLGGVLALLTPLGKKDLVPFSDLCVSGGMVDALEAVKLALTYPKP